MKPMPSEVEPLFSPSLGRLTLPVPFSDTPEAGPGTILNTPASSPNVSSSPTVSTYSPTATSSPSSKSRGSSSNVRSIAGGVASGVVAVSAAALILFFWRRRRKHQQGLPTAAVFDATPQPHMDEVRPQSSDSRPFVLPSLPETRAPPMRLYVRAVFSMSFSQTCAHSHVLPSFIYAQDPDNPTTFSWNQETIPVPKVRTQVPEASNTGATLANTSTSPPPTYFGFPTV
jgi:hypothetical protein